MEHCVNIYLLTCIPNGKHYVGITRRALAKRMREHRFKDCSLLNKAIRKHGWENFTVEILEFAVDVHQALEREAYWIHQFKSHKRKCGYNVLDDSRKRIWRRKSRGKAAESRRKAWKAGKYKNVNWSKALTGRDMGDWSRKRRVRVDGVGDFESITAAARHIGTHPSNLYPVLIGKYSQVRGFTISYIT